METVGSPSSAALGKKLHSASQNRVSRGSQWKLPRGGWDTESPVQALMVAHIRAHKHTHLPHLHMNTSQNSRGWTCPSFVSNDVRLCRLSFPPSLSPLPLYTLHLPLIREGGQIRKPNLAEWNPTRAGYPSQPPGPCAAWRVCACAPACLRACVRACPHAA